MEIVNGLRLSLKSFLVGSLLFTLSSTAQAEYYVTNGPEDGCYNTRPACAPPPCPPPPCVVREIVHKYKCHVKRKKHRIRCHRPCPCEVAPPCPRPCPRPCHRPCPCPAERHGCYSMEVRSSCSVCPCRQPLWMEPNPYYESYVSDQWVTYNPDRATADDYTWVNPDMNIDY